jgi:hypothetical protein
MHHITRCMSTALIVLVVLAGCTDNNLTAVDHASETALESSTAAKSKGDKPNRMVPFKGRWVAQADPEAGLIPCSDSNGHPTEVALPSTFIAQGQVTHLGRTHTIISGGECWFDADEGTITAAGTAVHTGANGDAIFAEYQNTTSIADGTFGSDNIEFVGGTGRFEGVTGYARSQGTINLTNFTASFSIQGMITPVGANRR